MTIQLEALKKRMGESEEGRQRQSVSRNYETIVFRKPDEDKAEDEGPMRRPRKTYPAPADLEAAIVPVFRRGQCRSSVFGGR